jgi:hypothetical protein
MYANIILHIESQFKVRPVYYFAVRVKIFTAFNHLSL